MKQTEEYDSKTGHPMNKDYMEKDLPAFLLESIKGMQEGLEMLDRGEEYYRWDCDYCDLQSSINTAEVNLAITSEQAWNLREKYLGLSREDIYGDPTKDE